MTIEDHGYRRPDLRLAPSPTAESHAFWTGGEHGQLAVEVFFEPWTDFSGNDGSRVWLPLFRPTTAD